MEQLAVPPDVMRKRVEETLDLLGIADLRDRPLLHLSGGQQQRVAIGSVLTAQPRILVLDEPTSALDPNAAEEVLAAVTRLVHDLGVTVVLAEHRLERVVQYADQIIEVRADGTVASGPPGDHVAHSRGGATGGRARSPGRMGPAPPVSPRCPPGSGSAPSPALDAPRPTSAPRRGPVSGPDRPARPPRRGPLRSGRRRARCGPRPGRRGGHGVDGTQRVGEIVAAVGPPGLGAPSDRYGRHRRGGSRFARRPKARGMVGLVPQTPADLLYLDSVGEECEQADRESGRASASSARALLDRLAPGIPPETHPRDLSEGQRLSLVLAVQLAAAPDVVLLDEPTRGLDYPAKRALIGHPRPAGGRGPGRRRLHPRRRVRGRRRRPGRRDGHRRHRR